MKTQRTLEEKDELQIRSILEEVRASAESVVKASESLRDVVDILSAYIEADTEEGRGGETGPGGVRSTQPIDKHIE